MTTIAIDSATTSDQDHVIAVLTLAFSTDPGARWIYPEPQKYLRYFPEIIKAFGGRALEHGTAYCVGDYLGAALWLRPGIKPNEAEMMALMQRTVAESTLADFRVVMEKADPFRPTEPYWYLPLTGVDPAHQGDGYGSELMKHALATIDREQKLAFLESTNRRNVPFYERHGFEVVGTVQVGSSPTSFAMLRRPQG